MKNWMDQNGFTYLSEALKNVCTVRNYMIEIKTEINKSMLLMP